MKKIIKISSISIFAPIAILLSCSSLASAPTNAFEVKAQHAECVANAQSGQEKQICNRTAKAQSQALKMQIRSGQQSKQNAVQDNLNAKMKAQHEKRKAGGPNSVHGIKTAHKKCVASAASAAEIKVCTKTAEANYVALKQ